MTKPTFRQKLRYSFDNTMSRGTGALIGWLALLSLVVILVASSLVNLFDIVPEGADKPSFVESLWMSLMREMDSGTLGGDNGWGFRIVMLVVTLGGIFILSTLIGVLSSGIEAKIDEMRKGRSLVIEENHTLILGWSSKVFTIISELVIANESQKRPRIVVMGNKDKVEMEDEIRSKIPDLRNTKVICRSGNPNDLVDLNIANPHQAKSIIILAPEEGNADSQTIKTLLAITNNPKRKAEPYHVIAEISNEKNLEVAKIVGKDEVELLLGDDLISRIMVQTCRQSGLSVVYTELMDFDGAEIYFKEENALLGKTFGAALSAYEDCAVIGLQQESGQVKVNPPMGTVIRQGDKLIAIAEDDETFVLKQTQAAEVDASLISSAEIPTAGPERTLILGWNNRGEIILRELNNYVAPGSEAVIVSHAEESDSLKAMQSEFQNLKLTYTQADSTSRTVIRNCDPTAFHHIILLSYREEMDMQESDSQTLITLLHLRQISEETGVDMNIVSEMLDMNNRELAEVTKADDFIVSDKLLSLIMSQVSENKQLMRVFENLFDAAGSEIYLKPVSHYVKTGVPVNFYTVLESAKQKNEVAIGYRIQKDAFDSTKAYGVKLNPNKHGKLSFSQEDKIIVLAED
jgi:voltage-gated potassium channel Kch